MPIGKNAAEAISSGRKPPAAQNFMGTRGLKKMKRTPPTKGAGGRAGSLRGPRAAAAGHLPHARTPPHLDRSAASRRLRWWWWFAAPGRAVDRSSTAAGHCRDLGRDRDGQIDDRDRFIPACAGNTRASWMSCNRHSVHPRPCAGNTLPATCSSAIIIRMSKDLPIGMAVPGPSLSTPTAAPLQMASTRLEVASVTSTIRTSGAGDGGAGGSRRGPTPARRAGPGCPR